MSKTSSLFSFTDSFKNLRISKKRSLHVENRPCFETSPNKEAIMDVFAAICHDLYNFPSSSRFDEQVQSNCLVPKRCSKLSEIMITKLSDLCLCCLTPCHMSRKQKTHPMSDPPSLNSKTITQGMNSLLHRFLE